MQQEKKYSIGGYAPGNYQCHCVTCGGGFIGDKKAVECKPCAVRGREKFDAVPPAEQKELMKRSAEAINAPMEDDDQLKFSLERGDLWKTRALAAELALEERKGAEWVKAKPVNNGFYAVKYAGGGYGGCGFKDGEWNQSLNDSLIVAYLDEAGQSKEGNKENDAVWFGDWLRTQRADVFYGSPTTYQLYNEYKKQK